MGLGGCASKPPPDFAPDPGLLNRITSLRIIAPEAVCPGERIEATYIAELETREERYFQTRYDKDNPPDLHVIFLQRSSPVAYSLENGSWNTVDDPLRTVLDGFPLRVSMRHRPELVAETVVAPHYGCMPHVYRFQGRTGGRGGSGTPGPDVTVRMRVLRSPFVERLLVAQVSVEDAPPFYVLADAELVPPADWLVIESRGGRGGQGERGRRGASGRDGEAGCPATDGTAGGPGGDGADGGDGGRGGRITVIVPEEEPFLAGLVEARTPGGEAGEAGRGGEGGAGGKGGAAEGPDVRRCAAGRDGSKGPDGEPGREGREGPRGPRAQVLTVPAGSVFGPRTPFELRDLLAYQQEGR